MNRSIKPIVAVLVATAVLTTGFAPVAMAEHHEKDAKSEVAKEKKPRAYPFRGKIGSVDKEARSITVPGKEKSRVFYFTAKTKITKNGGPATLADAKVGDEVAGTVLPDKDGKLMLNSVRFGPRPAEEKKKTKPASQDS